MREGLLLAGPLGCATLLGGALLRGARAANARCRARRAFLTGRDGAPPTVRLPRWFVGDQPLLDVTAVPRVWAAWWAAAVGGATIVGWAAIGPLGVPLALLAGAATPAWWARARCERARRRYELAVPDWLAALARSLRTGATLRVALADAGEASAPPLDVDVRALRDRAFAGESLVAGLEAWAGARPLPAVRTAAAALAVGERTGGLTARSVDDIALAVRTRLDGRAEVWALTAQVRASAAVMVVAPLAFLVLVAWSDASVRAFLARSPAGWACLVAGLLLDGAAAWLMRRMLRAFG